MERATAPQLRRSLEMAASLVKNRIRFVPMPVFDDSDELVQLELLDRKLDEMIRRAEVTQ